MKAEFNWRMVFKTCLVGVLMWACLFFLVGCASGSGDYVKYDKYYICDIPDEFIEAVQKVTVSLVLERDDYRKLARKVGVKMSSHAFIQDGVIVYQKPVKIGTIFHETGHSFEHSQGRTGHYGPCWSDHKQDINGMKHDDYVAMKMEGFKISE